MIYYAHSKRIYDTKQEENEIKWLRDIFPNIICPNNDMGELGSIEHYLKMVSKCGSVILSEYKKHIGKCVYEEVKHALSENKFVQCLRGKPGMFYLSKVYGIEIVDERDWIVYYGKIVLEKKG